MGWIAGLGRPTSLTCLFRAGDVFEKRVMRRKNRCRWNRSRATPLSEWASGGYVWVSSCCSYLRCLVGGCKEGRQLGCLFAALASPVCGYSGICLAERPSYLLLLMGNSVVPHRLSLAHRLPLDKTVFIIDVAQITWKNLGWGVVLSLWH